MPVPASKSSASMMEEFPGFVVDDLDIPFEEDLLRNTYSVKAWMRYLDHKKGAPRSQRDMVRIVLLHMEKCLSFVCVHD
ncbi:hypothetical protein SARC_04586 [Sphaeroforma arctica JP610]|uniref:Pre-mRNA-splicing factor Syf1-like N-terminal HAT-repeats domain-containing protein n=1 Tax=Sphaeroforma arctica JP610 TaxID=667725 RepID=A0A0L0G200_9EUKA|nr:hypothetical protein SARC_04586 [Sphaeroforma arctica JP610]KNC83157.1 hypothetical protein SARC_04586 [Sphaeroforma arctica JP610]|eukprot:XP_014157059.1 hypothetical protein SARC_04586 [Sphaeroforma arctica JP610]